MVDSYAVKVKVDRLDCPRPKFHATRYQAIDIHFESQVGSCLAERKAVFGPICMAVRVQVGAQYGRRCYH